MDLPRMDLHTHSKLSDGEGEPEEIVRVAEDKGLSVLAITDHYDPLDPGRYPQKFDLEALGRLRRRLSGLTSAGMRVLIGVEAGPRFDPAIKRDVDLVISSVHYIERRFLPEGFAPRPGDLFNADYWEAYKAAVLTVAENPAVDIFGHIEGYLPMDPLLLPGSTFDERREYERRIAARFFDRDWQEAVIRRALENDIAIEVHAMSKSPRPEFVRRCLEAGVKLSVGSDAHVLATVGEVGWVYALLEELKATPRSLYQREGWFSTS
ncbi:MAG: PHP domain-containing protein [Syntrophothermus sp.]